MIGASSRGLAAVVFPASKAGMPHRRPLTDFMSASGSGYRLLLNEGRMIELPGDWISARTAAWHLARVEP
jgi:hypothetical protein